MNPYFYWWFHWIKISMFAPVSIPFFHTYLNCVLVKILVKSACDYGEDFIWAIYTYLCPGLPWAGPYVHSSWFTMSWSICRCFLLISCADPYNICLLILSYADIHMCSVMLCSYWHTYASPIMLHAGHVIVRLVMVPTNPATWVPTSIHHCVLYIFLLFIEASYILLPCSRILYLIFIHMYMAVFHLIRCQFICVFLRSINLPSIYMYKTMSLSIWYQHMPYFVPLMVSSHQYMCSSVYCVFLFLTSLN